MRVVVTEVEGGVWKTGKKHAVIETNSERKQKKKKERKESILLKTGEPWKARREKKTQLSLKRRGKEEEETELGSATPRCVTPRHVTPRKVTPRHATWLLWRELKEAARKEIR